MRKLFLLPTLFLILIFNGYAQQDPMFTKYMFNTLAYNPAYAGSMDFMSIRLLYRNQWWGIEGAPTTQSLSLHTPLNEDVGVGVNLIHDEIGTSNFTTGNISYSYKLQFGKGKLGIGLQGGVTYWGANYDELKYRDPRISDEAFAEQSPSLWLPNFGLGLYYYTDRFYAGISAPHLLVHDLREEGIDGAPVGTAQWAKSYRHYFFTLGGAIPLNGDILIFKPSLLIKNIGLFGDFSAQGDELNRIGAPTEFDVDLSLFFHETLWVGASFRSAIEAVAASKSSFDSVDFWIAYYLQNGLRIGAAYDYTLTELQSTAQGSFEVMLGFDFDFTHKKAATPRYF